MAEDPPATANAPPTRQIIRFAVADDGAKIAYACSGLAQGQGPDVLRVVHFPTHLELDWQEPTERPLLDGLGETFRVVRFDERGSGLSDPDVTDAGPERTAEDMLAVADAAGLEQFALIGASGGARSAVHFAARYPERVSRLVLHGGYVDGRSVRGGPANEPESIAAMIREGWDKPDSVFVQAYIGVYFPDASPDTVRRLAQIVQRACSADAAIHHRATVNAHSVAGLLDRIVAPTLVVHSRDDAVHPLSEARKLASGIAGAELVVLEAANHYPLPGEPCWQDYMDTLLGFLART